jgi:hypothetical protein
MASSFALIFARGVPAGSQFSVCCFYWFLCFGFVFLQFGLSQALRRSVGFATAPSLAALRQSGAAKNRLLAVAVHAGLEVWSNKPL